MNTVTFILKFFLFSFFGYYIVKFITGRKNFFYGPISPIYGLFSILAMHQEQVVLLELFLSGIIWGIGVDLFASLIDTKMTLGIRPPIYGILNILNYFLIDNLIDNFLTFASLESTLFLFLFWGGLFFVDLSLSLRNNI